MICSFCPPLIAIYAQNVIQNIFHGPYISWYLIAMLSVLVSTLFAYRRIDLSAQVLFYVMIFESLAVFVFDAICFIHGYHTNGGVVMFTAPSITASAFGVIILFVVGNFFGFEATVIYREECKNPLKTIPRATFMAVIGIGVFYFIASWAFIAFYGHNVAQALSQGSAQAIAFMTILAVLNKGFSDVIACVVITSCFASLLSIHNVTARYLHNLGKDQVLPAILGKVHHKHHAPSIAASTVGVTWGVILTIFLLSGKDPAYLYALFAGTGEFFLTMCIFLASIAVVGYFIKNKFNFSVWQTTIAPAIGAIGLGFVLVMAVLNF